jgi:cytochrome b561
MVLILLGWYMVGLSFFDRWYHDSLAAHKSLGMIMLLLVLFRVLWLLTASVIKSPSSLISLPKRFNRAVFYILAAIINITGYLISTSAGRPIKVFDLVSFPGLISMKKQALEFVISTHYYLAYGSIILILVHAFIMHRPRILARLKGR